MIASSFFRRSLSSFCGLLILLLLPTASTAKYTLGIRDSIMIAHSFHQHPAFGPAGGMHGATYTCDVEFHCSKLQPVVNWVMDIGQASSLLQRVLHKYHLQNLDQVFPDGTLTTTEFMCRQIHADLCEQIRRQQMPFQGEVTVKLWESHQAWASYTGDVDEEETKNEKRDL